MNRSISSIRETCEKIDSEMHRSGRHRSDPELQYCHRSVAGQGQGGMSSGVPWCSGDVGEKHGDLTAKNPWALFEQFWGKI